MNFILVGCPCLVERAWFHMRSLSYTLPACRRLLFPLLHACNKENRRRLLAGKVIQSFVRWSGRCTTIYRLNIPKKIFAMSAETSRLRPIWLLGYQDGVEIYEGWTLEAIKVYFPFCREFFSAGTENLPRLFFCFDTVFQRPYRYFSIALKVFFSLSDRYKIFTSNWLWIEIFENVVLSKSILLWQ